MRELEIPEGAALLATSSRCLGGYLNHLPHAACCVRLSQAVAYHITCSIQYYSFTFCTCRIAQTCQPPNFSDTLAQQSQGINYMKHLRVIVAKGCRFKTVLCRFEQD